MSYQKKPCVNYTPFKKDNPGCKCGWARLAHLSEQKKHCEATEGKIFEGNDEHWKKVADAARKYLEKN